MYIYKCIYMQRDVYMPKLSKSISVCLFIDKVNSFLTFYHTATSLVTLCWFTLFHRYSLHSQPSVSQVCDTSHTGEHIVEWRWVKPLLPLLTKKKKKRMLQVDWNVQLHLCKWREAYEKDLSYLLLVEQVVYLIHELSWRWVHHPFPFSTTPTYNFKVKCHEYWILSILR